jgi:protein-S-isoprenylcysteine O-methyltransferase Ste14
VSGVFLEIKTNKGNMFMNKYFILLLTLGWGIFEFINGIVNKIKSGSSANKDRGSRIILNITIDLGFFISFLLFIVQKSVIFQDNIISEIIGILIFLSGIIIRFISIISLKSQFSYSVNILNNHKLINTGVYHMVRHPSYLGLILILSGISILMNNWICIIVMIVPNLIAIIYRIKIEESALIEKFGQEYIDYIKRTKCIIPLIY